MEKEDLLEIINKAARDEALVLDLSGNNLSSLPPEIGKLSNLTELDLSYNQLSALPPEIGKLTNLTELHLDRNELSALPPEIGELTNLTMLDLGENQLSTLPPEIGKLTNLTMLNLSSNHLSTLPPEIGKLSNLTELDLSYNQLSALPPEIGELTKLTTLDLYNNQLSALPSEITKLTNLATLDLSDNQLPCLPPEITKLTKLTELDLYNNQLSALPTEIGELTNLTGLYLMGNQLSALPTEIGELTKLTELDLRVNKLSALPSEITKLTNLTTLDLRGNPLERPPLEIAEKGIEKIRSYFQSLEGEKEALNEVKVLFIGDGGAGKTSLIKQLQGEKFDKNEPQTHGINISDWKDEKKDTDINVHFWDFGGQEIMHATHQFFLSRRSLYVLVLDGRKDEKTEYWLKHIESFGGDSPVLVVLNKMDENPGFDVNRRFLMDKYSGIKGFYYISCKNGKGIKDFSRKLSEELAKVELINFTWAKSWFNVKTQLEDMEDNFITYDEYKKICEKEDIVEVSDQDTLVDFLNDLGVILHFKDFELLDTHVLEPKWVVGAVYKIINSEKLAKDKGILKLNSLREILKKQRKDDYVYPRDRYGYIINLMKKFELSFKIDDKTVLIPDLLEVQEPEFDFDYDNSLKFVIEYDFLPRSVMPRFIVKMHKGIKGNLRWRTGVVLEDKAFHSTAVIKSDDEAKKIYIDVDGEQKRDFFSAVLYTLREINGSFEKIEAIEKVPMPDDPEITMSYQHLIRLERKGIEYYIPDGSDKEYNVKDLLGTIHVEKKTEEEILQILRELKVESDNEETLLKKVEDSMILELNIMGLGVDIKKLIKNLFHKG
ncbi:MAG: COR domain-containing protein [Halobacteriota archaeon]|nr:COR domain-containing protein [Halobacteriota archaeon]